MKTIFFVCVHDAGRSQMAEAFTSHTACERDLPVRAIRDQIKARVETLLADMGAAA